MSGRGMSGEGNVPLPSPYIAICFSFISLSEEVVEGRILPVFAQSAILIYSKVCNMIG